MKTLISGILKITAFFTLFFIAIAVWFIDYEPLGDGVTVIKIIVSAICGVVMLRMVTDGVSGK